MRGGRQLEPAADDGAMQHRDHGHTTKLDGFEGAMPHARMFHALKGVMRVRDFREVEAGGEMRTFAGEYDRADRGRQLREETFKPTHGDVVERVALFGSGEREMRNGARPRRLQRRGKIDGDAFAGLDIHERPPRGGLAANLSFRIVMDHIYSLTSIWW